ncbi:MAG: NAD(P)-dependent oxidoreductase [Myxococcota bacterium]
MAHDSALAAEGEIGRINAFFPILPKLGNRWAASRPWDGLTIGLNLHLTTTTAALVKELRLGGGRFVLSAASPATTDAGAVALLRDLGVEVYTADDHEDPQLAVLDHEPHLLGDAGFELIGRMLDERPELVERQKGAVESTRSGIVRLRGHREPPGLPIINIHDGRLKDAVENRHGVGEGVWQAVTLLTGMHLAGRRLVVVGYGPVGRGLAAYARAANMSVEVVESDPVRRLFAHYDGYPTGELHDAVANAGIVATATGAANALDLAAIQAAPSGVVLLNAGHGNDEIDVPALKDAAERADHVADQVVRFTLEGGKRVTLLGDGNPLNIVTNSGSPEPVLLHSSVLGLTLEWIARFGDLADGEQVVPAEIETRAAILALEALDPGAI